MRGFGRGGVVRGRGAPAARDGDGREGLVGPESFSCLHVRTRTYRKLQVRVGGARTEALLPPVVGGGDSSGLSRLSRRRGGAALRVSAVLGGRKINKRKDQSGSREPATHKRRFRTAKNTTNKQTKNPKTTQVFTSSINSVQTLGEQRYKDKMNISTIVMPLKHDVTCYKQRDLNTVSPANPKIRRKVTLILVILM